MRNGVLFPERVHPGQWVAEHGQRARYDAGRITRLGDVHRGARPQTSSRPVGVGWNSPAIQTFGAPILTNAMHAVASNNSSVSTSKWKAYGR